MSFTPPKILIGAPTAKVKNYCIEDWVENVKGFLYPTNVDIFLADNSEDSKNSEYLKSLGIDSEWVAPDYEDEVLIRRLTRSHNLVRQKALDGNYDFLLHLESDIFPPPDVLLNLLAHRKQVISVSYDIYDYHYRESVIIDVREEYDGEPSGGVIRGRNLMMSYDGNLKEPWANGIGCMLIHKSILKEVPFRYNPERSGFCDSWFAEDLRSKGIPMYVDTSMYAGHRNKDWRKFGTKFVQKVYDKDDGKK